MFKVAVVGDKDSILAFKALGVDVFTAYEREETRRIVDSIARNNYGIIFITEQLAQLIPDTIERYNKEIIPAVILIPSNQGTLNIGMNKISESVEKAVGTNILW